MAENKTGYKTSEFWLSLAAMVVSFLIASGVVADASTIGKAIALVAGVLASLGYTVARGAAKKPLPPPE